MIDAPLAVPGCFGCGSANTHGFKLVFEHHPEGGVQAAFVPESGHQGYDGMMHGGLVTVLLDEAMAWAAASKTRKYVTARLAVRYRRPVRVGQPVHLRGWLDRDRGRRLEMRAEVRSETDDLLAAAEAVFVQAD
ncbi:MAG: PaaI family thioesterase [Chloroflexota bacterium]